MIYTDVLDKENVYTALSRQNRRLLNTLTMQLPYSAAVPYKIHCTAHSQNVLLDAATFSYRY